MALPGVMLAQAQRMSADWLQLTPADPRTPIGPDGRTGVVTAGADSTTVSIDRRTKFRSRSDSVAGTTAYEASKRDRNLHISVSLEEKKLWVVAGQDTVMEAPIAISVTAGTTTLPVQAIGWPSPRPGGNLGSRGMAGLSVTLDASSQLARIERSGRPPSCPR